MQCMHRANASHTCYAYMHRARKCTAQISHILPTCYTPITRPYPVAANTGEVRAPCRAKGTYNHSISTMPCHVMPFHICHDMTCQGSYRSTPPSRNAPKVQRRNKRGVTAEINCTRTCMRFLNFLISRFERQLSR